MIKIALILSLLTLPFLGFSQSPRKINKALKDQYTLQLHKYDSLIQSHESIVAEYSAQLSENRKVMRGIEQQQNNVLNKKREAITTAKTLMQLEVIKPLTLTLQSLDSITIPNEINRIQPLKSTIVIHRKEWTLLLDDQPIKQQNERLATSIDEVKQMNDVIVQSNRRLVEFIPKIAVNQQELVVLGTKLNTSDAQINHKLTYLREQKERAKNNFITMGPKGFNESYFKVFPEVFPASKPKEIRVVNEGDMGSGNFGIVDARVEPKSADTRNLEANKQEIYDFCDELASFPGGPEKLKEYLITNLKNPKIAVELAIEGKCYLQFIVSDTGNISNVRVMRGVPDCPECDEEAVRVVKGMPKWNPGKNVGVTVNSTFTLPVSFKLQ